MNPRILITVTVLAGCAAQQAQAPSPAAHKPPALEFIEDDYAGALSLARQRGVPLFVDVWAPW